MKITHDKNGFKAVGSKHLYGVVLYGNKYLSKIKMKGRSIKGGLFDTELQAHHASLKLREREMVLEPAIYEREAASRATRLERTSGYSCKGYHCSKLAPDKKVSVKHKGEDCEKCSIYELLRDTGLLPTERRNTLKRLSYGTC